MKRSDFLAQAAKDITAATFSNMEAVAECRDRLAVPGQSVTALIVDSSILTAKMLADKLEAAGVSFEP